ncbi:MAG: histidine--tRNA ligase [Anaerolineales bacterium]
MKKPTPVKGTRDYYPADMAFRNWLYGRARDVSRKFGYQEFEAPFLETLELYAAKSGEELVKEQAFVFQDRGGEEITLRPELTPSLARMVSARIGQLTFPVRWWSYGPFWRYERPQKGRTREFFQWNLDLIGVDNPQADAEIAAVICEFFRSVNLTAQDVKLQVNNRRLMEEALSGLGIREEARAGTFRLIDKKEKMDPAAWEAYAGESGLNAEQVRGLQALLGNRELWMQSGELTEFFAATESFGVRDYVEFHPAVIRGLDYYTGTVFEARDCAGEFRAILGGGRYDNLVEDVGGEKLPGVGFAMGDLIIGLVLKKREKEPALRVVPADVLVTTFSAQERDAAMRIAQELRKSGIAVEWYPSAERLPKQLKYADALGIPLAVIAGPDEIRDGKATLKDLAARDQVTVRMDELAKEIRKRLAGRQGG